MIEVVKYGKRFATCPCCNAVLKFDEKDIKTENCGYNDYDSYIECPVCTYIIYKKFFKNNSKSETYRSQ